MGRIGEGEHAGRPRPGPATPTAVAPGAVAGIGPNGAAGSTAGTAPGIDPGTLDRALGAYLGFAIGDALGATVATMTRGEIALKYGVLNRIVGGGWLGLRAGQVSDDTEMTLAIGRALIGAGGWHLKAACEALAAWLRGAPIDVGPTCRRGIRRFLVEGTMQATESAAHTDAGGCARNLPVALATLGNAGALAAWTREQCHITHNHPLSDGFAIGLGHMLHVLIGGAAVAAAAAIARALVREHPVLAFQRYQGPCSPDLIDIARTALHHAFAAASFRDCVVGCVNAGGEADTAGALAGMLAGARFGAAAIPRDWLRRLDPAVAAEIRDQVPALLRLSGAPERGAAARP